MKIAFAYILPLIVPIIITVTNVERQQRGQTDFSFAATYGLAAKDERHSKAYLDAAYPDIPAQYASKIPTGLVLGKHKGKYAYCPIDKDGINGFVVGTPGSGKSVLLLGWLYSMMFRNEIARKGHSKPGKPYNYFLVDIKGELFEKLLGIKAQDYKAEEHKDFQVVAPAVESSYGYDVFYKIHRENVTETEIIKAVTDIADALVVATGDNPYFSDNAKKILSGVLYYFAKQGYDFLPIIQTLMRTGLDELLTAIVADAENQNMGVVLDKLKGFVGKSDNESVADIETTLKSYLEVFSYPELQWTLHGNPNKTSPAALNDGTTNLDLAIHESMLVTYQPFFRLVTIQILRHCESEFKEEDDRYTMLIVDEAARVGKLMGLSAAMSTLRSKHTALVCLFQSISQFKDIYPKEEAMTLLNLCELKLFLSGSGDKDSTDYVSGMVGQYDVTKMAYKRKGVFGGKSDGNYSSERRAIVEARDLLGLRERGEAIVFLYGHYIRCKKLRYFEDPYISPILKRRQEELAALHKAQAQVEPTKKDTTT
ncbi:MAG: type IV secretory system conjugative DNA transfer family protein [Clostridia bacterium]|nr:type IV secretory system conjugative DNA transfer family protein [Clostridia bacterium]